MRTIFRLLESSFIKIYLEEVAQMKKNKKSKVS